jgi:hypothetical protein
VARLGEREMAALQDFRIGPIAPAAQGGVRRHEATFGAPR